MNEKYITKGQAVERAESICRRRGIEVSRVELARIINKKKPDGSMPMYFCSVRCMSPRLTTYFALLDIGDFEDRFLAALKHYEANKPLMIRGREIKDEEILDPGFDWSRLDEDEDDGSTG